MILSSSEYKRYLASREWAAKREAVRARSKDMCERCRARKQDAVHHLTYERVGHELLEDLQAICTPCHEFLSAKREDDPALLDGVPHVNLTGEYNPVIFYGDESYDLVELSDNVDSFEKVMEEDQRLCELFGKFARKIHPSELINEKMKDSFNVERTFVLVTKIEEGIRTRIFVKP